MRDPRTYGHAGGRREKLVVCDKLGKGILYPGKDEMRYVETVMLEISSL